MKLRQDFVTNSSSSSYIIAYEDDFEEKASKLIVEYIKEELMGHKVLSADSTPEEIEKFFKDYYVDEKDKAKMLECLSQGKSIYYGSIDFECADDHLVNLHEGLWNKLKESGCFEQITEDLWY